MNEHAAANIINQLSTMQSKAVAWDAVTTRIDEAIAYCREHKLPIGQLVWHAILDDAIKLRKQGK